jgi:hypothetical protein
MHGAVDQDLAAGSGRQGDLENGLMLESSSSCWGPLMALRHSYACIGRYASQQPPPPITLLWAAATVRIIAESATALARHKAGGL